MILSRRHKFLFIKGRKVAGTSVEMALSTICAEDDIITAMLPIDEKARVVFGGRPGQNYSNDQAAERRYVDAVQALGSVDDAQVERPKGIYQPHMGLRRIAREFGDLSDYFIFAVDRNPYAKCISLANMQQSYRSYRVGGKMEGKKGNLSKALDKLFAQDGIRKVDNIPLYQEPSGRLKTRVLQYETLQDQLRDLAYERGWSLPDLPHAKQGIMSDGLDPRELLRRDQLDRINQLFASDFDRYGYERL